METIQTPNLENFAHPAEALPPVDFDARIYAAERSPEADERLHALDDTIRGYQADHRFIEGATVFGSTAHGEAHSESDIDAFVFVDPNELPEEFSSNVEGETAMTERDHQEMGKAIQVDPMNALGKNVVKGDEHEKNDVRVVLMCDEIIADSLNQESEELAKYENYLQQQEAVLDEYYDKEIWLTDTTLDEYKNSQIGELPELPLGDWGIAALFHPAVGEKDAIQHLRGAVVEKLSQLPNGQTIWKDIIDRAAMFEGNLQDKPGAALPSTLEEAAEVFPKQ